MEKFAEVFIEKIIKNKEYRKEIVENREDSIKKCIERGKNDREILKRLLIVKVTKGFWRSEVKFNKEDIRELKKRGIDIEEGDDFEKVVERNGDWTINFFAEETGKIILSRALEKYYKGKEKNGEYENLRKYFFDVVKDDSDIKKWIDDKIKNKNFKNIFGKGLKSKNIFLRDIGKFEFAPIDIHEKRFLIRTGIFQYYLGKEIDGTIINDPFDDTQIEKALKRFSKKFLTGEIEGYKLADNPGIVDMFIWYHCAKKKEKNGKNIGGAGICGKNPRCNECPLKDACLMGQNVVK